MKIHHILTPVLGMLVLNSCYFNSAQHFTEQAGYKACSKVQDIKNGDVVYSDGTRYYVELPRYRVGKKIYWQISSGAKDDRVVKEHPTGDKELFEVPQDFALYLTDPNAKTGSVPTYMTRVKDPDEVKKRATTRLPIVYKPGEKTTTYKYSSPNAVWWWTGGVFSWLCVDLPLSCTEMVADISAVVCLAFLQLESDAKAKQGSKYGCSVCGGDGEVESGYTSYVNGFGHEVNRVPKTERCSACGGSGWNEAGEQMVKERKGLWPPPWHLNL